jgi:hypothetical protein
MRDAAVQSLELLARVDANATALLQGAPLDLWAPTIQAHARVMQQDLRTALDAADAALKEPEDQIAGVTWHLPSCRRIGPCSSCGAPTAQPAPTAAPQGNRCECSMCEYHVTAHALGPAPTAAPATGIPAGKKECPDCGGSGYGPEYMNGSDVEQGPCPDCNGTGLVEAASATAQAADWYDEACAEVKAQQAAARTVARESLIAVELEAAGMPEAAARTEQAPDAMSCPHGRQRWTACPHCTAHVPEAPPQGACDGDCTGTCSAPGQCDNVEAVHERDLCGNPRLSFICDGTGPAHQGAGSGEVGK